MGAVPDSFGIGRQLGRCGPMSYFGERTLTAHQPAAFVRLTPMPVTEDGSL